MKKIAIQQIAFGPDSVQIGYYEPDSDVKANGLAMLRTLVIPTDDEYEDEIAALTEAAVYLVNDALEDLPKLPAMKDGQKPGLDRAEIVSQ